MAKSESVEALLNPTLRVSRPVAACSRCRSAKVRCDGKLPACSACERVGKARECSSANDDFAKGKERSYVAALETSMQKLSKRIKQIKASKEAEHIYSHSTAMGLDERPLVRRRPISGSKRKEASDMDELVSDLGILTVNATSRDFHGVTSMMTFARLLMATALKKPLPELRSLQLPPRHTVTPLVDHYFINIYVLLPFLSETSFMGSLNKLYGEPSPMANSTPLDHWHVHLVLAISAASTCAAKGDSKYEAAIQHICTAMQFIEYVIHPGSVAGIQALLLLVQFSMVDPEHFDSWYLIGMASRLLVDLGLHCEPAAETKHARHVLDLRQRVFYCVFALDRHISMANGYAFSFTDDSAVLLPTLAADLEPHSPTPLFLPSVRPSMFLFDIRRVQSSFYQTTRYSSREVWSPARANDYISSMLGQLHAWHSRVPTSFDQRHLTMFFVEYLYSQILAISPCQILPVSSMMSTQKAMILQLSGQFADQMQLMVQQPASQAFLTYTDICRAKAVGRQFQDVLGADFDMLLRQSHALSESVQMSTMTSANNCTRAISFINKITLVLDFARARWGLNELRERFEQETAVLLANLKSKEQEFEQEARTGGQVYASATQSFDGLAMGAGVEPKYEPNPFSMSQSQPPLPPPPHMGQPHNDVSPAMHRSNLMRSSYATEAADNLILPTGSLPRRSYEFMGNLDSMNNT